MRVTDNQPRKLYRSRSEHIIGGVCGGLADYFNTDVVPVRIIAVAALLCGSLGFWGYLAIWIITPLEPASRYNGK